MTKRFPLAIVFFATLALGGCKDDDDDTATPVANTVDLTALISGSQQVPALVSAGAGSFAGTYNRDTKVLKYTVLFTGITPIAAHIHLGAPGRAGGVKVPFTDLTSPIEGEQVLDQPTITCCWRINRMLTSILRQIREARFAVISA